MHIDGNAVRIVAGDTRSSHASCHHAFFDPARLSMSVGCSAEMPFSGSHQEDMRDDETSFG